MTQSHLIHEGERFVVRHYPRNVITTLQDREAQTLQIYRGDDAIDLAASLTALRETLARNHAETYATLRVDYAIADLKRITS